MKLFVVMAILLAPLAQTVSAQSNCSQSKSNPTVQSKQEKKNKKTNAKAQKEASNTQAANKGKKQLPLRT
jgi:hypothetical protein